MDSLNNLYDLFGIQYTSNSDEILNAYQTKINKFKDVKNFTFDQISEIKQLKKGLYILLNKKLRLKYNNTIDISDTKKKDFLENEPFAMNHEIDNSLDSVFNIDNSWMDKQYNKEFDKKNNETNVLSDRIFSLSNLNKKPGYSTNDEIDLRKPLQGRIDKNID